MHSPHILLIEDNDDHAHVVYKLLKRKINDLVFYRTNTLQQGLEFIETKRPNVLLLDLCLPDSPLNDTLTRALKHCHSIPIVVLTSLNEEEFATRTLLMGAQDYLLKEELNGEVILRAIRHAIERKQLEHKLKQYAEVVAQASSNVEKMVEERTRVLSQSEKQYRSLVHLAPVGIITLDQRGKIEYANPEFRRLFGFEKDELSAVSLSDLIFAEDINKLSDNLKNLLSDSNQHYREVIRLFDRRKREKWCNITISAMKDDRDQFVHFLCIIDDISKKKLQERLEKEKKVAELANNAKTEFLTNISHEIRTPLTAITGFIDLAIANNKDIACAPYLDVIRRNSHHLVSLVNDLLDLSKIDAGQLDINISYFSLLEEIKNILSAVRSSAEEKCLEVEVNFLGFIPKQIRSDPQKFRQIFINLINNAIKYTDQGGVYITFRVEIIEDNGQGQLIAEIQDTGIGIDKGLMNCLFQPFSRGADSRVLKQQGMGIGLALSRSLARRLGGDIILSSSDHRGTKLQVTLSLGSLEETSFVRMPKLNGWQEYSQERDKEQGLGYSQKLQGKKLLVAEDAEDLQMLIQHYLRMAGAEVAICSDGEQAVRLARAQDFDAILMDIQMPKMNGYEATRELKGSSYPGKIIALTAHAFREERDYCLSLGFDGFLTKPIVAKTMLSTLADLLTPPSSSIPMAAAESKKIAKSTAELPPSEGFNDTTSFISTFHEDPIIRQAASYFFNNVNSKVSALQEALKVEDWQSIAKIAHQIKGSSSSLGYGKIAELSNLMEEVAKTKKEKEKTEIYIQNIVDLSQKAKVALQK